MSLEQIESTWVAPTYYKVKDDYPQSRDSSFLRYIKTLTNHQTNAKQQRMDIYLQNVKHVEPIEEKDIPSHLMTSEEVSYDDDSAKSSTSQAPAARSWNKVNLSEQNTIFDSNLASQMKGKALANTRKCKRLRLNDSCERFQSKKCVKKPKQTPLTQKIEAKDVFDHFRLYSGCSQRDSKASENETILCEKSYLHATIPAAHHRRPQGLETAHMHPTKKFTMSTHNDDEDGRKNNTRRCNQKINAVPVTAADVWKKKVSPDCVQVEGLDEDFSGFAPTCDPLGAIMKSIYF